MAKLTKRVIDATRPQETERWLWDSELKGFGLRVYPNGRKRYICQYRTAGGRRGRTRRVTLGPHGVLTADAARAMAKQTLARVALGEDPAADRDAERTVPTMSELWDRYLDVHGPKKKDSSLRNDRQLWKEYVAPRLARLAVRDVTRADIATLHARHKDTPYAANRALSLASFLMSLAVRWEMRADNPCVGVERYREEKRRRYLSGEETGRLGVALADAERTQTVPWQMAAAVRLLALTGARLSEILTLRWEYVDLEARCLNLTDSKTGAKTIHLNAPALQVLAGLPRETEWVLPGRDGTKPYRYVKDPWARIRRAAELPGVRLHDLRHSYASVGAATGASLPMIGALLGHTQPATTARYAHLAADPVRALNDRIGARIGALLAGTEPTTDNVVPFKQTAKTA